MEIIKELPIGAQNAIDGRVLAYKLGVKGSELVKAIQGARKEGKLIFQDGLRFYVPTPVDVRNRIESLLDALGEYQAWVNEMENEKAGCLESMASIEAEIRRLKQIKPKKARIRENVL